MKTASPRRQNLAPIQDSSEGSWSAEPSLGLAETFSRPLCSPTSHAAQPCFLALLPTCRSGGHFLIVSLHANLCLRASLPAHPRVRMLIITISLLAGLFLAIFRKLFHLISQSSDEVGALINAHFRSDGTEERD